MPSFEVIRASVEHAALLGDAVRSLHEKPEIDADALPEFLRDPRCISFLAVEEERVVGSLYGYALRRPETLRPKFFLYEIDVAASHRRRGVGRALVMSFLDEARRQNAIDAWVQAKTLDPGAQSFYSACGGIVKEDTDTLFHFPLD